MVVELAIPLRKTQDIGLQFDEFDAHLRGGAAHVLGDEGAVARVLESRIETVDVDGVREIFALVEIGIERIDSGREKEASAPGRLGRFHADLLEGILGNDFNGAKFGEPLAHDLLVAVEVGQQFPRDGSFDTQGEPLFHRREDSGGKKGLRREGRVGVDGGGAAKPDLGRAVRAADRRRDLMQAVCFTEGRLTDDKFRSAHRSV